jgi:pimeloyl-ACP methyl ester carboxylesterase
VAHLHILLDVGRPGPDYGGGMEADHPQEGQTMVTKQSLHIAYDDIGSGDPAVVLLHGLFANRTYYRGQVQHLTERHRVLNLDLRGHGESDIPEHGYSLDIFADDVIRVCDRAGVRRAVFCGHSFPVALRAALRRPDLAAGVVLLDGVVLFPPPVRARQGQLAQALQTDGWREALLGYFPGIAGAAAERVRADISAAPRFYAEPMMRELASSDSAEELAALGRPLMYVHSGGPADLERLRQVQPDAIIEEIPGAGHWSMLTAPDRVNALLDRYLEVIG